MYMREFQMKELIVSLMAFTCHYDKWALCPATMCAMHFILDHGLFRNENDPKPKDSCIFQDVINLDDNTTANKMTTNIQQHVPANQKSFYSAKSIRIGATTTLQNHPLVQEGETIATGGWSSGNTKDSYAWPLLATLLPGMMCLLGYPDPRSEPFPPSLAALLAAGVASSLIECFISHLYAISLVLFKPEGRLRPFLEMSTACFIMHFPAIINKLGTQHKLYTAVMKAAVRAKICGLVNWSTAMATMKQWSQIIQEDYDNKKLEASTGRPMINESLERLRTIAKEQKQYFVANDQKMEKHFSANDQKFERLSSKVDNLSQQNSTLVKQNTTLIQQQAVLVHMVQTLLQQQGLTLPTCLSLPTMTPGVLSSTTLPLSNAASPSISTASPPLNASTSTLTSTASPHVATQSQEDRVLPNAFHAMMASRGQPIQQGHSIVEVLEWLYDHGKLKCIANENYDNIDAIFGSFPVHEPSKNRSKYRDTMRLVFSILTQEERALFATCNTESTARLRAKTMFGEIADAVNAIRAIITGKSEVNKTCKATYFAVGTAIAKPKNKDNFANLCVEVAAADPPKTLRQHAIEWEKNSRNKKSSRRQS
jgi:hypothetical protein